MRYLILALSLVLCILETIIIRRFTDNKRKALFTSAAFSFLGIVLMFTAYLKMLGMTEDADLSVVTPAWYENFALFNRISLIVSGVLLFFCFCLRLFRYFEVSSSGKFSSFMVDISSVMSSFAVLLWTMFFSMLTSGGNVSSESEIVLLGCGEAFFLLLPTFIGKKETKDND